MLRKTSHLLLAGAVLFALAMWLDWFDLFHLLVAVPAATAIFIAIALFSRRRQSEEPDDEPAPWLQVVLVGLLKAGLCAGAAYAAVFAMEATPLYSGYVNRDLPAIYARIGDFENAGDFVAAADVARQKLAKPIGQDARRQLSERLVMELVQAARRALETGDQAGARAFLTEAKSVAKKENLASDLLDQLLNGLDEDDRFHARLEIIVQAGDWEKAATALRERLAQTTDGMKARILAQQLILALVRMQGSGGIAERSAGLREAAALAAKYNIDETQILQSLKELDAEVRRRADWDRGLASMISKNRYDDAEARTTEELVRAGGIG